MWYSNIKIGVATKLVTNASAASKKLSRKSPSCYEGLRWRSYNEVF